MTAVATPLHTDAEATLSRFRRVRRQGFHLLVRALVALVRVLPAPLVRSLLVGLTRTVRTLDPASRRIARAQVDRAFPELGRARARRRADRSWDALAHNLVAMVRADAPVHVDATAATRIEAAAARGPVVVLMAHLGAWELAGPVLVRRFDRFAAMTANPHNARVDRWLRAERRARGVTVFDRERELGPALRWLRDGGALAVFADHRPRGTSVPAPWFNREVATGTGPGRLARAAGAVLLPVGVVRDGSGHRLAVHDAFDPTGDAHEDARRCNAALEELIRLSPEEWTWIHERPCVD